MKEYTKQVHIVMANLIDKDALVAEIEREKEKCGIFYDIALSNNAELAKVAIEEQERQYNSLLSLIDTLEVKEVDIDKLCEFRKNIGFAYPDGASEYQKQLACYRQGIKDAIKAQKGEKYD